MNGTSLVFEAQYLHDSIVFRLLLWIKLTLALVSVPLLWRVRGYKAKVLVHQSLSILMKFHYHYVVSIAVSPIIDYSLTIYKYHFAGNYIISCGEHFMRRYPQVIAIHGSLSSIFMMSIERYVASTRFRTYEGSAKNIIYFWGHVPHVLFAMTLGALAYDPRASYAASTASPEGGQIYHQILSLPVTLMEFVTVGLFEYLFRLNAARMRQTGFSLTERYQIAENMRTLELLRPLARFHCVITCAVSIVFLLYGRTFEGHPAYPIFEESMNIFQLQAICMPVVFIQYERKEKSRNSAQLARNSVAIDGFLTRYTAEITRGW